MKDLAFALIVVAGIALYGFLAWNDRKSEEARMRGCKPDNDDESGDA